MVLTLGLCVLGASALVELSACGDSASTNVEAAAADAATTGVGGATGSSSTSIGSGWEAPGGAGPFDPKGLSESCQTADQCESGQCVLEDGICCESACTGTCEACVKSKTGLPNGVCAPIAPGSDPETECLGGLCDGDGGCCGDRPVPQPAGACPPECTGGCDAGVCQIDCTEVQACRDATMACPEGYACELTCDSVEGCRGATLTCPDVFPCTVTCLGSSSACRRLDVVCGSGVCETSCGDRDVCQDLEIDCGSNLCRLTCDAAQKDAELNCEAACGCELECDVSD